MEKVSLLCVVLAMILNNLWANGRVDESGECQKSRPVTLTEEKECVPLKVISEEVRLNERADDIDSDIDYGLLMAQAIANGDYGQAMMYNEHLDINYNDLFLLSKIVDAEAGSSWLTEEHRLLVASVIINRVNSPEYPNTIYDVVYQKGQYAPAEKEWFAELIPSRDSVMAAYKILSEGSIAPPDVVYQANFRQGSGVYKSIHDSKLGTTYFCYSAKRNIYK